MACILHGMGRHSASHQGGLSASVSAQATISTGGGAVVAAAAPKRKAKVSDFWSKDTPPFMIGPGTGRPRTDLGPGAIFGQLDNGDDCIRLPQLERRLYHEHTMKPRPRPAASHAQEAPPSQRALASSASAPSLGAHVATSSAQKPKQVFVNPLPYPCSEVGSETSEWKKQCVREAPPGLHSLGLMANDLTYAHANSPGVCVRRAAVFPRVQDVEKSDFQIRMDHVDNQIRRCERMETRRKARNARPPSPGGSSQGAPCEVLPKAQQMTRGKASLCKPLPADLKSSDKRARYSIADDSLCTSEHRSNFWWKSCTDDQMEEIKQFVRPLDSWVYFRNNAAKSAGSLRYPINTY